MLDGFGYVPSLVALLVLAAVAIGVVLGRYAWPRRGPYRQDPPAAAVGPGALGFGSRARSADTDARLDQALARAAELEARLKGAQSELDETLRQLRQTGAELLRMRLEVRELEKSKEAEMGRLESGAIAALESTMATHREQVAKLEEKLRAAESTAAEQARQLTYERSRAAQMQSALAERDEHIATLMSERT